MDDIERDENLDDSVVAEESAAETVKKLRTELKTAKQERDEYLAGWQRAKADYTNQTREHSKSRQEFGAYADEAFFEDLLPVLESFGMAFSNKEAWEKAPKDWRTGVEYIHTQLIEALKNHHITEYEPKIGDTLDPRIHAPVGTVSVDDESKDHTVVEVIKKGYRKGDKILRPADVKIGESSKE